MAKTFTQDYLDRREERKITAPKLEMAPKTPKAIEMVMNPVQQLQKVEMNTEEPSIFQRALDTIAGSAKSTGSQAAELGGLALTGLAELNRKKSSTAQAYYQAKESAERYRNLLKDAKTEEDKQKWQSLAERYTKQEAYFKSKMDEAVEYQSVLSGAETVYEAADDLRESAAEDLGQAKQGLGAGGQLAVDFASTAAQWAGDAALGAVTGTGMLPMMLRAAGGGAQQARLEGATPGQQAIYGLGTGAVAGATEKIANFASPLKKVFGKGLLDDAIQKATGKMSSSAAGRIALSFISEGGEEMLESVAQPILQNLTYDAGAKYDAEWLGETLYQGLMGGLLGGVLGGAGEIGTAVKTRNAQKTTGAEMAAMGDDMVRAIIDSGLEMDPGSQSYKLAKAADKKVKAGKKLTNAELGKLFMETDREYQRKDQAKNTAAPAEQMQTEDAGGIVLPTAEETAAEEGRGIVLPTGRESGIRSEQAVEQEEGGGIVLPEAERTTGGDRTTRTGTEQQTLEETAQQYGVDANTTARVRRISDAIGRKIEFYKDQDTAQNGYYNRTTDTIYINANSRNPVAQIIGHELTHSIEQAGSYAQLQDAVFQEIQRRGTNLEQMRENKRALYARHGVELTDQNAVDSEIVAEFIEKNLLTDEESIRDLVRSNRTLAEKIWEQIDKLLAKLGNRNAQEKAFLNRAKRIYTAALNETAAQTQTETEPEPQTRLSRKQRREQEERRQREQRNERIQEKVRTTDMDKEELAAAYAAGELTEEEFDRAMDNILSDEGEIGEEQLGTPAEYSIDENYARDVDAWDQSGRPDGEVFVMGETGAVLQGLGAMEQDIYIRSEKINTIMEEHPEMTLEEIKRIPEILDDPVLVLKSRNVGREGMQNNRLVVFGAVKAQNGQPVLTVLDLQPFEGRLLIEDMQKVKSAYTKNNDPVGFLMQSEVLFADEKRTAALLRRVGFQMPTGLLRSGSMGSITYRNGNVNLQGVPFDQVVDTTQQQEASTGRQYSFGGENARRADLEELERAKEMDRQGVAAETIFRETGWYTGADGKWRFEFDDTKAMGANVDTEQAAGYDGERMSDQQGGLNNGQNEYDSQGVPGEDVRRGIERSDSGRERKGQAGNGTDRTGDGSPQGPAEWARENLISRPAPAAGEAAENAARYGADVFVVKDSAIKGKNPRAWALTSEGKIYISDDLPSDLASVVGFHEAVHAAKQNKNQRYLDFVDDVGSYINFQSDGMDVLGIVVQARFPGKDLMDLRSSERETVYDELNALVWGFHKADPENAKAQFAEMFRDYDTYIADLDAVMENGAESWRDPGMLPTAEEYDGGGMTNGYDSDWRSLSADQQSYFKDSVARDESGRLMVLYHGSASPLFTEFNTDNGVWLTPEESYARNYADIYDSPYADTAALTGMEREIYMPLQRQRMYEVYADLRNVANLGEINGVLDEAKLQEIARESGADLNMLRTIAEPYMGGEAYEMTRSRAFIDAMRDAGFDGMYAEEDGVPTFCAIGGPEQVKLTSNKNPSGIADIRYSVDEEAARDKDQAAEVDVISALPKKAQAYLQSAERRMVNAIGNSMNVPYRAKRDFLQEAARKISVEYLKKGKITQETMDSTFEQAYEAGRVVDDEFYRQYKDLKEYLRTVPVTISQEDASDIADYNDFKKSTFGSLRITNEGGTPVDIVYEELRTMAPELFPGRITHPADQLVRMFDVAKSIQRSEKNLDEYYGENAQEFKRWAKNEFETAVSNGLSALRDVKRYTEDRARKSSFEPSNMTQDEVMKLYEDLKKKRKDQEKVQAKNLLTAEDEKHVNELLKGMITPEALNPETSNVKGILEVFKAKEAYEEVARKLRSWNAERRGKLNDQADEILQTANDWKDKRAGILYSRETMERNIRDIVPDKELAEKIITTYFTPVHKAAADANRLKNRMRGKVKELGLSQKVSGHNEVSEAHAVQLLGEAEDNIRVLENSRGRTATRDGKTLEDWKAVVDDLWHNNPDLDQQKIRDAVGEFRKIYDELFQQMNDARVRNGYEPINYRKGYFPHFQPGNSDGILDAFGRALGISTEVTALPTTINGLTHTFKPGIRYMGNALERLGFNTAYDAVEGFDRYIEGAADVIYQTDNIQRLRALARQARYRTGDEGIRKQVDDVLADTRLTEVEKTDKIDKIYENGRFTLSNFVVELDEYTNLLANKKSRYDRSMEYQAGRASYNLMKSLSGRVAANMVAVNPASWLTNFIPLTQGGAMVGNRELLTGMWDTLKAYKENDGFVDRSTFLTNRRGSDPLVRAWSEQMSAIASQPMTWIDSFVADSLVRARYSQNLKNGLSEQAAMDEADQWVAGVMADRSKGSTPTLFQRNNPLTKLFTQFQLEVNNQLSYVAKDMPREYKEKGKKVLAAALLKFALGAFLFDELYEFFIGRRPALDPIGILNDTAGDLTGYELPNLVSLGAGLLTGDVPDFETERTNGYETVANLAGNILESTPFVGSLLGGGRLPISNALPDAANLANAAFNGELPWNKRLSTAAKELGNPLTYLALPFGGGQLKKVFQGVKAVAQGGRYSIDSSGEKIMQYPVYNDSITDAVGNLLTGTIFGVTSTEGGKEWIESDFKSLNAAQTETYLAMQELGVDGRTAFDLITTVRDAGKTGEGSTAQLQRKALYDSDAPGIAKAAVFYGMLAADSDREVMDQLDNMGADMGSVAYALMKIKDADLMKGAQASNAKRDAIKAAVLTDDEKAEIYRQKISDSRDEDIAAFESAGLSFDDFLEAQNAYTTINEDYEGASRKALEFSRWVNQQDFTADQAAVVKDSFAYYSMVPQSGSYYDKLIESGLDDEAAYQISSAMEDLEPEDGEDSVSKMQRYKAITESGISAEDQMAAMAAVMTESEYSKLQAGYAAGVMPESYIRFKELLPEYDADGNGSFKQEEVEAAIRAIPGLSNAQRAALWQMQNKSWKPSGNPFSTSVSQRVYNDLQSDGAEMPTETTAGGGIMLPMA